jgi:hypothetical protein
MSRVAGGTRDRGRPAQRPDGEVRASAAGAADQASPTVRRAGREWFGGTRPDGPQWDVSGVRRR